MASKKQKVLAQLKENIANYFKAGMKQKKIDLYKQEQRKEIEELFDELDIDILDIDYKGKTVRAQRYVSQSVNYDVKKLLPILKKAGIHKRVIKMVIDHDELEKAYNRGDINIKDIKSATTIKTSQVFRIQEVKNK